MSDGVVGEFRDGWVDSAIYRFVRLNVWSFEIQFWMYQYTHISIFLLDMSYHLTTRKWDREGMLNTSQINILISILIFTYEEMPNARSRSTRGKMRIEREDIPVHGLQVLHANARHATWCRSPYVYAVFSSMYQHTSLPTYLISLKYLSRLLHWIRPRMHWMFGHLDNLLALTWPIQRA